MGYYQTNDGSQHGFLYNIGTGSTPSSTTRMPRPAAFSITQITGISDSGEIAGFYVDAKSGLQRGFVATGSVPEPSSIVLLGMGAALAAGFAVRRGNRARRRSE